jgi:shikimate kinase
MNTRSHTLRKRSSAMFQRDVSIVLLGVRGCGKTSLNIIAQASLGLRHIDADNAFHKETGVSAPHFRRQFGAQESRTRWLSFLAKLLSTCSKNCAIVWPKDYIEEAGLSLLKQYGKDHPVILVQRDTTAIKKYLQLLEPTKIERIVKLMTPTYRSCSNYEYFNLDETESLSLNVHSTENLSKSFFDTDHQAPRSLRLKHVEERFLRLVKNIMQPDILLEQDPDRRPLPQSRATYTYLLTVSVAQMSSEDFNMRWLDCGADAIQLEIESDMKDAQSSPALTKERISRAFAAVTGLSMDLSSTIGDNHPAVSELHMLHLSMIL